MADSRIDTFFLANWLQSVPLPLPHCQLNTVHSSTLHIYIYLFKKKISFNSDWAAVRQRCHTKFIYIFSATVCASRHVVSVHCGRSAVHATKYISGQWTLDSNRKPVSVCLAMFCSTWNFRTQHKHGDRMTSINLFSGFFFRSRKQFICQKCQCSLQCWSLRLSPRHLNWYTRDGRHSAQEHGAPKSAAEILVGVEVKIASVVILHFAIT